MGKKRKKQAGEAKDDAEVVITFEMIMDDVVTKRLYNTIVFLDNAVRDTTAEVENGAREPEDRIYLKLCLLRDQVVELMEEALDEMAGKIRDAQ